jgi:hypothetical protein
LQQELKLQAERLGQAWDDRGRSLPWKREAIVERSPEIRAPAAAILSASSMVLAMAALLLLALAAYLKGCSCSGPSVAWQLAVFAAFEIAMVE